VAAVADAMICLSSVGPAPPLQNAGMDSGVSHTTGLPAFNAWTSLTGAPAITLPLLALRELPLGVQIVGQHHSDHQLTGIAKWLADVSLHPAL
jgi:Asp-tRNA(Asn)/Glu-tRNA(Gln) amidotransferase A subunit family amidase